MTKVQGRIVSAVACVVVVVVIYPDAALRGWDFVNADGQSHLSFHYSMWDATGERFKALFRIAGLVQAVVLVPAIVAHASGRDRLAETLFTAYPVFLVCYFGVLAAMIGGLL